MRLEWLEDILAIAETGSFSGAAERRMLTQSAFSRRIKQIEDYAGVELFNRDHKPIRLKPTTEAQREQILQLSNALRQLVLDLRRGERMTSNRVVIACQHSLTAVLVPSILRKMPSHEEGVYIRLRSANLGECTGLLLSRQADVAIIYNVPDHVPEVGSDFLEELTIGTDQLIPVFNAALPVGADAVVEFPCISYPSDVFFGQVMDRRILPFLGPSVRSVPNVETALTLAAVEMAASGIGVAWVPKSLVLDRISSGALVDLSSVLPSCDLRIKAMRLQGKPNLAEAAFWSLLPSP
jgi:DNA-binding transcriptional LysR family regulator